MMDAARLHIPAMPTEQPALRVLRYDLPLARPGEAAGALSLATDADADYRQGNLRVRVLNAEGLPARADGSACEPYATVVIAELTRRRTKRTRTASGSTFEWGEAFHFEAASPSRRWSSNSPRLRLRWKLSSVHRLTSSQAHARSIPASQVDERSVNMLRHAHTGRLEGWRRGPRGGCWRTLRGYVERRRLDSNPVALLRPIWRKAH